MRTLTPALTRARSGARTSALTAAVCLTLLAAGVAAAPVTAQPEAVATFPSDQATENIVQAADGAIYVTGNADRVVWRVTPGGVVERWADLTGQSVILGVAMAPEGAVVTATARPVMRAPAPGATAAAPQLDLSDVGPRVLVLDTGGRVAATVEGQKGSLLNGITAGGPGWYLVADSGGGALWRLDLAARRLEPWLRDARLASAGPSPVGANGVKVRDGWVYVSVSGRQAIYRVRMDAAGKPSGALETWATGIQPDDFDLSNDGALYLSVGSTMHRVSPTGQVSTLLNNVPNGAAVLVSRDGKWLYWPTRGAPGRQRLLRVPLP